METVLAWVVLILIVYIIKTKKDNKFKTSDNINMIQAPPTLSSLYDKKIYLLTSDELKFYKLLKPIVNRNELNLFTQVALYEIVKAKDIKNFINKNREVTVHLSISVVENVIWLLLSKNIERSRDII
ncbi:unknown [Clostridium sp. CAG:780]|nr:unknown [Clostridium sp. CAG:780]